MLSLREMIAGLVVTFIVYGAMFAGILLYDRLEFNRKEIDENNKAY